jgi:hypothetical protein
MIGTNVKKTIVWMPLLIMAFLAIPAAVSAAEKEYIPITGNAYGEKVGLLHFDYRTAAPKLALNQTHVQYVGPTKQYLNPQFIATGVSNGFPINESEDLVARISTAEADCNPLSCLLRGFMWSDKIGWIVLDGDLINEEMDTAMKALDPTFDPVADKDKIKDPYTTDMYPRIRKKADVGLSKVAIIGLAWNRHAGWIRLSDNYNLGKVTLTASQTATDWGAWLDVGMDPEFMGSGADRVQIGRKLRGNVWSEKLGWIKLGAEAGDEFGFQAYTTWVPDDTAPLLLASDDVWFSVGVNTGYDPNPASPDFNGVATTVVWKGFTMDPQSLINTGASRFYLRSNDINCADIPDTVNTLRARSVKIGGVDVNIYDLSVPGLGIVKNPNKDYCEYALSAKIYNGSNLITYLGDDYLTNPMPKVNSIQLGPIKVRVRSGNVDIRKSTVVPNINNPNPGVLGDGKETFGYKVQLMDVASNPIQPVCDKAGDTCPRRDVAIRAEIKNDLLFDLTKAVFALPYTTPLMRSDREDGSAPDFLTSAPEDATLDVNWDPSLKTHSVYFASAAPNSTYSMIDAKIKRLKFNVERFTYAISNVEALPATSKVFDDPTDLENSTLSPDPLTVVPAYDIDKDKTEMPPNPLVPVPTIDLVGVGLPLPSQAVPGFIGNGDPTGFTHPLPNADGLVSIAFNAPIATDKNPDLSSGGLANVLTVGLPAELTTSITNMSDLAIFSGTDPWGLSVDNIFTYESPSLNPSVALMETQRIAQVKPLAEDALDDNQFAWTDPIEGATRYELFDDQGFCFKSLPGCNPTIADPCDVVTCDSETSPFHTRYEPRHTGKDFCYDSIPSDLCVAPNTITSGENGSYKISGAFGIPQKYQKPEVGDWPAGKIDRNDIVTMKLKGTAAGADAKRELSFRFTPEKFVPVTINDIQVRLFHDIAYRYPGQHFYSVFTESPVTNFEVKDIGLEAKGTVVGQQLSTGRKFDTVGTASTRKLQEQIRRNVAQLISGTNVAGNAACSVPVNPLSQFDTDSGECFLYDSVNATGVRYYEGKPGDTLVLGDGSGAVMDAPKFPYTIVIKGGANLFIRNDIRYVEDADHKRSSLGIIVIAENIGQGANVFLSPAPTNVVGSLYAEGSLLGCSEAASSCVDATDPKGALDFDHMYYGAAGGDIQDLKNQLFWQGSIAGAGVLKIPDGIVCPAGDTELSCAQRYDLDYLRRFTPSVTPAPAASSLIMNNGKFSGGGCCDVSCGAPVSGCTFPNPQLLPSTVVLSGDQIDDLKSELSTFYIEPSKRATFIPPGFSLTTGQETTQTIR